MFDSRPFAKFAANGVMVAMAAGRVKVRCGPNASHVIVDVIGSLL